MHAAATAVIETLHQHQFLAYFAGGCVRDYILKKIAKDIDIATSATPQQIQQIFPQAVIIGKHFMVTLLHHRGQAMEIATFRKDGVYLDNRRPSYTEQATAQEDVQRRDFTINGLFYCIVNKQVIDYTTGLPDLKKKLIRTIGSPSARFAEDALRLLRAVRFATVLDFTIEPKTYQAIKLCSQKLTHIASERIQEEFNKILLSPHPSRGISLLVETGLMQYIIPVFINLIGRDKSATNQSEKNIYQHILTMLQKTEKNSPLVLILAILLYPIALANTSHCQNKKTELVAMQHANSSATLVIKILQKLKYSNTIITGVVEIITNNSQFNYVQQMSIVALRKFIATKYFDLSLQLHYLDCLASNRTLANYNFLQHQINVVGLAKTLPPPLISGNDLKKLSYRPGPIFKSILQHVQDQQLANILTSKKQAITWVKQHYQQK